MQRLKRSIFILAFLLTSAFSAKLPAQIIIDNKSVKSLLTLSQALESLTLSVSPAVVQIFASGYAPVEDSRAARGLIQKERSTGSGVILSSNGYIVTNRHVVQTASRVQVLLASTIYDSLERRSILKPGGKLMGAQVVGTDRETDLAVLKIDAVGLPFLVLGDSDQLRKGQLVLALGSPFGLENSATLGVVSSVARQFRTDDPMIYIQTDATINPGNSGGPLIDVNGRVIGINTFIFSQSGGSEGVGFAAPSNIVRAVFDQIRDTGRVKRGEIGVNAQTITSLLAQGLKLPKDWGVVLADVYPGSPADIAGLKIGDVVLTLDGKTMENGRQFDVNLYRRAVGDKVVIEVLRGMARITKQVTVVERRNDPGRFTNMVSPESNLVQKLGILALDLDDGIRRMLPSLRQNAGVVVAAIASDAPFRSDGLLPGDVIYAVNGRKIVSLKELRSQIESFKFGDAVVIQFERSGQNRFAVFEME